METVEMIIEGYTRVLDGMKRVDYENETHIVKVYQAGTIVRIDVKEK